MALPPVSFPTLGWQVIDWIEAYLCHGPGDVQGELWTPDKPGLAIDDEEALFICWVYRVWPQDHPMAGRRLVHRAIYSRPKGRRKSEIAGALDCAEGLGPVRCDGFDAAGEPVGAPVTYPFIRCLATEEEQAGNTYDNVVYMLTEGEAANEYDFDIGRSVETSNRVIVREPGGGEIRQSSAGDASKDGGKESKATADETHLYVQRGLRAMHRTVARNTGKRKVAEPWMLDTTTMFESGENSVAEQAAGKYAHLPVEECVTKHGVLYDHREGDEPKRFGDNRSLKKALRTAYGPAAEWMDFDRIVKLIRDAEDPEAEAYRYWLNRLRPGSTHWLSPEKLGVVLSEDVPETGAPVGAGFDGSDVDDHTALWIYSEDGLAIPVGIWAPSVEPPEWRDNVDAAVRWTFENFRVIRFYGDPPWWQHEMGGWAKEFSDPDRSATLPVAEWWTNRDSHMGVACGAMRTEVNHGTARINTTPLFTEPLRVVRDEVRRDAGDDGEPIALWHLKNARTRKVKIKLEDRAEEAHVVRKDRPGSAKKIDSAPALVLAKKARDDGVKLGEFEEREENYGRAAWQSGSSRKPKGRTPKSEYLPCRNNCGRKTHPAQHKPDAPEKGLCLKCRLAAGGS